MKKVLRILKGGKDRGFYDLPDAVEVPRKGDNVVFKEQQFVVSYVEYDFDASTVVIACL
jgi:hypothetical protein